LERELFDRSECRSNSDLCGRFDIWMKKPLENMIFLKDTRCSIVNGEVAQHIVSLSKITRLTLLPSMLY
jgi:arginine deiminase